MFQQILNLFPYRKEMEKNNTRGCRHLIYYTNIKKTEHGLRWRENSFDILGKAIYFYVTKSQDNFR